MLSLCLYCYLFCRLPEKLFGEIFGNRLVFVTCYSFLLLFKSRQTFCWAAVTWLSSVILLAFSRHSSNFNIGPNTIRSWWNMHRMHRMNSHLKCRTWRTDKTKPIWKGRILCILAQWNLEQKLLSVIYCLNFDFYMNLAAIKKWWFIFIGRIVYYNKHFCNISVIIIEENLE